jgi:tagatose 6-phosphate kinase
VTRVVVVTLNPAVDITYHVDGYSAHQVNRVKNVDKMPGGKGINVLRVMNLLGLPARGIGFLAGRTGAWIAEELEKANIAFYGHLTPGETRSTTAVIDGTSNAATELIEPGPFIGDGDAKDFLHQLITQFDKGTVVVVSGSQPPGLAPDYTAAIVRLAKNQGSKVCVDVSGSTLDEAIIQYPTIVKVNEVEFRATIGAVTDASLHRLIEGGQQLLRGGTELVVVTRGSAGSLAISHTGVWQISAPAVPVVNPVGSGDAFCAGLVAGLARGGNLVDALAKASACGASNATFPVAGLIDCEQVETLMPQVVFTQPKIG